jgi:hypothetical protein
MDRLRKAMGLSRQVKRMAMDAIRRGNPELDDNGVRLKFIEINYGKELADEVRHWQEQKAIGSA